MLHRLQTRSFRRAKGLIFLTQYAYDVVSKKVNRTRGQTVIIPHGIDKRFVLSPRAQSSIDCYCATRAFRVLYVSIINVYKHQWFVVEAVKNLRKQGFPVELDLIGPAYPPSFNRLRKTLDQVDPREEFVRYVGAVPYAELSTRYSQADMFVFASSCENMPIILLEAMASGLPIACSNRGPMPEVLGDGGVYFNPEKPAEILNAIKTLIDSPDLRYSKAQTAFERAKAYSWRRCSQETFQFLSDVAKMRRT